MSDHLWEGCPVLYRGAAWMLFYPGRVTSIVRREVDNEVYEIRIRTSYGVEVRMRPWLGDEVKRDPEREKESKT